MTNREKTLFFIFVGLCIFIFFYFTITTSMTTIKNCQNSIRNIQLMQKKIIENKNRNTSVIPKNVNEKNEEITISDITEIILNEFEKNGISLERYKISNSSSNKYIEMTINCSCRSFINYIFGFEEKQYPYKISNLNIRNNSENLFIEIRYVLDFVNIRDIDNHETKNNLIHLLRSSYKATNKISEIKKLDLKKDEDIEESILYKIIGYMTESDGLTYLYLKKKNSSRVYKIPPEEIIEDNEKYYIVVLEQKKIKIYR